MAILKTKELRKYYGSGDTCVKALDGVDLAVEEGEFVAVVGTSGSGKSTLLHMIGGLDRPTKGTVTVAGKDIFSLKDDALTVFRRRKIGFVFQNYNLVPVLTVYENIVLPIELDGGKVDKRHIDRIIKTLGLTEKVDSLPNQLSGGQQQRVAIGRALMNAPAVMLADEPTGSLDSKNGYEILQLLKESNQKYKQTLLLVTHDENIALQAERILTIADGRVVRDSRAGRTASANMQNTQGRREAGV